MKIHALELINIRVDAAEDCISDIEDKVTESTQVEKQKNEKEENRLF